MTLTLTLTLTSLALSLPGTPLKSTRTTEKKREKESAGIQELSFFIRSIHVQSLNSKNVCRGIWMYVMCVCNGCDGDGKFEKE